MSAFNIFDVEPLSFNNPSFNDRLDGFSEFINNLPDKPGSVILTYGLLDAVPYRFEFVEAPAGDIVALKVEMTDLLRTTVISSCEDTLSHPDAAELVNEPGFFRAGLREAVTVGSLSLLPAMQLSIMRAVFDLSGFDAEKWLTDSMAAGVDPTVSVEYVTDRCLVTILTGSDSNVDDHDSVISVLSSSHELSELDVSWLASIVATAKDRIVRHERLVYGS